MSELITPQEALQAMIDGKEVEYRHKNSDTVIWYNLGKECPNITVLVSNLFEFRLSQQINLDSIVKSICNKPLSFSYFTKGTFGYHLKELNLYVDFLLNDINGCELSNVETIQTLFESIYIDDDSLDFYIDGKFVGSMTKQKFSSIQTD